MVAFPSGIRDEVHGVLRVAAGLLFMQHGAQKLFGWLDGRAVDELASLMGLAGVLEFFGGLAIAIGLFTVPVAVVLVVEMAWAYVTVHLPQSPWPIANGGELALLYLFIFLFLAGAGAGAFSVDRLLRERRGAPAAEPARARAGAAR